MNTIAHPATPQEIRAARREAKKKQAEAAAAARLNELHKLEQLDRIGNLTPAMKDFDLAELTLVADLMANLVARHQVE